MGLTVVLCRTDVGGANIRYVVSTIRVCRFQNMRPAREERPGSALPRELATRLRGYSATRLRARTSSVAV